MKIMACKTEISDKGKEVPGEVLGIYYQVAKV